MRLDLLLEAVEVLDLAGDASTDVVDVAYTSAGVRAGSLFCCLPGRRRDGHEFAADAVARGATALLVERNVDTEPAVAQARVANARSAMGFAASALHGNPSHALQVVGTTGTNGKSTTSRLVQAILDGAGMACGLIGTMNNARTTPEAPDLQAALSAFVTEGKVAASIEVSSVGLVQRRLDGTRFAVGIFTNLSPDELWIHESMEEYFRAKAMLFEPERTAVGVVNVDDEWGRRLADERASLLPIRTFSLDDAHDLDLRVGASSFTWRGERVDLPLDASYNVMNALAALTATAELGVDASTAAAALSSIEPIAGHGDPVDEGQPFRVVVDFAHTAGALASVLTESRRALGGEGARVMVVFGCGGDRDPTRRPLMGEAAARHADVVVVTSDNPRSESPAAIVTAVAEGARKAGARDLRVVEDRREAIESTIADARPGDVIVIAGKGHETGQIVGGEVLPFDDAEVAREALRAAGYGGAK
ncbi:MAG TPA: UDP-N-acetylmuramoyl-L-alanyl-D-glutamate--2,6-diaminopimelate ligase [Acidimicrobiales bacterium]|nr:UDP-N-acetylmuramoyl-L-alanyl-D-glutamate--2,6-diaminopimelate ligase [Acidimicrobiales bacterium]